jgi:hypothetical protein
MDLASLDAFFKSKSTRNRYFLGADTEKTVIGGGIGEIYLVHS